MWWTINIIIIFVALAFVAYGIYDDSYENYGALMLLMFGGGLFMIGLVSSAIKIVVQTFFGG